MNYVLKHSVVERGVKSIDDHLYIYDSKHFVMVMFAMVMHLGYSRFTFVGDIRYVAVAVAAGVVVIDDGEF